MRTPDCSMVVYPAGDSPFNNGGSAWLVGSVAYPTREDAEAAAYAVACALVRAFRDVDPGRWS